MTRPGSTTSAQLRDLGLLILRVGLGAAFVAHGLPKLLAGPHGKPMGWESLGNMAHLPMPVVFGFLAAVAETAGGLLVALGLLFRPACAVLFCNLLVALVMVHLRHGDSFLVYSHALEDAVVFLGLVFIGPGRYSVDARIWGSDPAPPGFLVGLERPPLVARK